MATDSSNLGIPLPADSTKISEFPAVTRRALERVAEVLAGGLTEGQTRALEELTGPAVAAEIAAAELVKASDPGIPAPGPESTYSMLWRNTFFQAIMGLTAGNRLELFKGLQLGGITLDAGLDETYVKATRNTAGRVAEDALLRDGTVPAWILERWKTRMGFAPAAGDKITYTVKPDGTGDYLTPKAANDAFREAPGRTCDIIVHPGTYPETEWTVKAGVTIRGTNRAACRLAAALPPSASDAQISGTSVLWLKKSARLENLTITARNMRYAVHAEADGAEPGSRHDVMNCHIEHFGNQDVIDYRAANNLPAGNVWAAPRAWGYGSSSGWYQRFENVTLVSPESAFYVHDNKDFAAPISHDLIGCRLIGASQFSTLDAQSLGAGQSSRVNIYGSEVSALCVMDSDFPWITQDPARQVAQHSEIAYTIAGTAPIGFRSTARGKALKIESASTGPVSTVRVSGTAAAHIFGPATTRDGGGGLKGYAFGHWDISGILVGTGSNITVNNTLGRRLGDCSTTPKTLTVSFDGGPGRHVVFTANHTADANAVILGLINAALAGAGTAAEYLVTQGETYPVFPDRQRTGRNAGPAGIPRFAAVKSTDANGVALLGPGDSAALAGVALEPIAPGKTGLILTAGLLHLSQIPGFPGPIIPGTPVYLSDTAAGQYAAAGTRQALTGYAAGWAKF